MISLFSNKKTIAALVVPGLAVMLFAMAIPLVISLIISFTRWSLLETMVFIGFDNYIRMMQDNLFWRSLYNVLLLTFVTITVQFIFAFFIASLLTKLSMNISQVLRTIYFIPATLSLVVVTRLWVNIYHPSYGMLNRIIQHFGFSGFEHAWLGSTSTAIWAVIWIMIWQGFGWSLLFFYGGLMTVPKDLEEAALVDGANKLQLNFYIKIPYMMPVIQSIVIIAVISSLKQMEMIFLSTEGGPGGTTQFLAVHLYIRAFRAGEFGYGNALSVATVLIAVFLTFLVRQIFKKSLDNF